MTIDKYFIKTNCQHTVNLHRFVNYDFNSEFKNRRFRTASLTTVNLHKFVNYEFNSEFKNRRFRTQVLHPRIYIGL